MDQLILEIAELTPDKLGNQQTVRENSQRGDEVVKIPLDKLVFREGFNVRTDYGDLEGLAQSILENGQTVAGRVDVLENGTFLVVEGHRRSRALFILRDQGHEGFFKAIVNGKRTTEEQRIIQMFTTQDSKPLLPHEVAELFKRLINLGYKPVDISSKVGKSTSYVSQMLSYADESKEIKDEVAKGSITVSTVVKLKKEIPSSIERTKAIKETVSANKGKKVTVYQVTKISGRDMKEKRAKEITDKVLEYMEMNDYEFKDGVTAIIKQFL